MVNPKYNRELKEDIFVDIQHIISSCRMDKSIEFAKYVYDRVKSKLAIIANFEEHDMKEVLKDNGFSGQFWSLKFYIDAARENYPTLDRLQLSSLEKSLNFRLPPSYLLYLNEIANGGIGGWSSLIYSRSPQEITDEIDLVVMNFPTFEVYYSPTKIPELDLWEEKYSTGKGLILSEIDNGDYIFLVCKGFLPGTVWWSHLNESRYVPLAEDFLSFLIKNLLHTEKMVDVIIKNLSGPK